MSTKWPIETDVAVETDPITFEVDMAGDPESKKLALLLHGFPESKFSWRYQMPLLADQGYRVWAPNQRGYGHTTRPKGVQNYTIDHLVSDAGKLMAASGCEEVLLVGHDWGGAVAWAFALNPPRPIDRLVIMNLPHPTIFGRSLRTRKQFMRSWYTMFFQIPGLPEKLLSLRDAEPIGRAFTEMAIDKSRFPTEVTDVYRRNALLPGALTGMVNWYRGARKTPPEWREVFQNPPVLETPTLMIWGEEDTALGIETTYGTEKLVRDFTLRYLPQVSHWVQQEAPEVVNRMLEAWLSGQPVPQAETEAEKRTAP